MNKKIMVVSILSILVLSGCKQTDKAELVVEIEKIKANSMGFIPDPPPIIERVAYNYKSDGLKSPFRNSIGKIKTREKTLTDIKPDLERERGILESQDLSNFFMTGVISLSRDESPQAIVKNSRGNVYMVSVGDYIGKNNGKIKEITDTTIKLEEIVPNGPYWVSRPSELTIIGD